MARKILLAVGISSYKDSSSTLAGPVHDLERVTKMVKDDHGFSEIVVLKDSQATGAAILDKLFEIVGSLKSGDMLIFYFSGHGYPLIRRDPNGKRKLVQCLAPWETDFKDPAFQHLTTRAIREALTPRQGVEAHITVILDCCFSGNAMRALLDMPAPELAEGEKPPPVVRPRAMKGPHWDTENQPELIPRTFAQSLVTVPNNTVICLAACKEDETAADTEYNGKPGGAFTFAWLEAHKTPANNGWRGLMEDGLKWLRSNDYGQTLVIAGPEHKLDDPSFTLKGAKPLSPPRPPAPVKPPPAPPKPPKGAKTEEPPPAPEGSGDTPPPPADVPSKGTAKNGAGAG